MGGSDPPPVTAGLNQLLQNPLLQQLIAANQQNTTLSPPEQQTGLLNLLQNQNFQQLAAQLLLKNQLGNLSAGVSNFPNTSLSGTSNPTNANFQPTDGPPIQVQQSRIQEPLRPKVAGSRTIFVGNLSDQVTDQLMFDLFEPCGEIKSIHWLNERKTGKFRGCGFITFYNDDATSRAIQLNGTVVLGRPMRVDYAGDKGNDQPYRRESEPGTGGGSKHRRVDMQPQTPRPSGCKTIFIGNLPDSVTDQDIFDIFGKLGAIREIRWLNDKQTGRFRGCGFVEFEDEQATIDAAKYNGTTVCGRPMRVDYSQGKRNRDRGADGHTTGSHGGSNTSHYVDRHQSVSLNQGY
jgi:nucleolin